MSSTSILIKARLFVIISYFFIYFITFLPLQAGEAVPSNEQQRRKTLPLQDHRVSAHQLPGRN